MIELKPIEFKALCRLIEEANIPEALGVSTVEAVKVVLDVQRKMDDAKTTTCPRCGESITPEANRIDLTDPDLLHQTQLNFVKKH